MYTVSTEEAIISLFCDLRSTTFYVIGNHLENGLCSIYIECTAWNAQMRDRRDTLATPLKHAIGRHGTKKSQKLAADKFDEFGYMKDMNR